MKVDLTKCKNRKERQMSKPITITLWNDNSLRITYKISARECAKIVRHAQTQEPAQAQGEAVEKGGEAVNCTDEPVIGAMMVAYNHGKLPGEGTASGGGITGIVNAVRNSKVPAVCFGHPATDMCRMRAEIADLRARLKESTASFKMMREARATHRCKVCSALWVKHPGEGGWSLCTDTCGKCCDAAAMSDQIEEIGVTAERGKALAELATMQKDMKDAAGELRVNVRDCGPGSLAGKLLSANVILRHANSDLLSRAVDAEWDLSAENERRKKAEARLKQITALDSEYSALMSKANERDVARAEADRLRTEVKELKARKVNLMHSTFSNTTYEPAITVKAAIAAIRAAGVEVEVDA